MKRTLQVFYWISGDPPFDSYELTLYAEHGEPLPTASALLKTMVAANDRLAGKYLRMWKVSIPARNFDELVKHPLDPSKAILPPEGMDLYLKDPPVFGHISFIVQAVKKRKVSEVADPTPSKRIDGSCTTENVAGPSEKVLFETRATKSAEKTEHPPVPIIPTNVDTLAGSVNAGKIIGPERDRGPVEPHAESPEAPSKRARLDYSLSDTVDPPIIRLWRHTGAEGSIQKPRSDVRRRERTDMFSSHELDLLNFPEIDQSQL